MANIINVKEGTQIRFIDVAGAGFSPADPGTNWSAGTPTDSQMILSALADAAGRQSTKIDLGAARHLEYDCFGCVDFTGETPAQPGTVDYYWAPSHITTVGSGNVAGNSGIDAAAPGGALGSPTRLLIS